MTSATSFSVFATQNSQPSFPFQEYSKNYQKPTISSFYESNEVFDVPSHEWGKSVKLAFSKIIEKRINYLKTLETIGHQWVSGGGTPPSQESILIGQKLLATFNAFIQSKPRMRIPKMVMSPMPIGGICIEFHIDTDNAMFITIPNNEKTEIDIRYRDFYFSYSEKRIDIGQAVIEKYDAIDEF